MPVEQTTDVQRRSLELLERRAAKAAARNEHGIEYEMVDIDRVGADWAPEG